MAQRTARATRFTERDREVYEAHSATEVDGRATTRQMAELLHIPIATLARRLVGMQRRGLVERVEIGDWDETADWLLTWDGCADAAAAVPELKKFDRWLNVREGEAI